MRATQKGQSFYKLSVSVKIQEVLKVGLSTLQDNFLVIYTSQQDIVFENSKKTEFLAILMEYYQNMTGRQLTLEFTDSITWKTSIGDLRTFSFAQDPSAPQAKLKKMLKVLLFLFVLELEKMLTQRLLCWQDLPKLRRTSQLLQRPNHRFKSNNLLNSKYRILPKVPILLNPHNRPSPHNQPFQLVLSVVFKHSILIQVNKPMSLALKLVI